MNILFNCNEYPPFKTGGIGSVTKIVAEGLVKRGHNVTVAGYYLYQPKTEEHSVQNGVHVYRYSLGYRDNWLKTKIQVLLQIIGLDRWIVQKELDYYEDKLQSLINEYKVDVLELTDYYNFNYCKSPLEFHKFSIPTVMRFHGSAYYISANAGTENPALKLNDLLHFARAGYFSYVSQYVGDFVKSMGGEYKPEREVVIHNMVEDGFLNGETTGADSKTILYIGKLVRTKGAYSTAKAFDLFHRSHPDWKLVMAGMGSMEPGDDVIFPGFCTREKIKELIDSCSFACVPSYFETFGMVPLEFMARRKAVIFTSRTSGPEIIQDGIDGILVDPDDVAMIAEKMAFLSDNTDRRNEMALNAYNRIKESLCESRVLDSLEDFYKHLS